MSPLPFQLCDNYICLPIIVPEFFSIKSSIVSVILCNPQFYHTYVRWNSSVLSDNISTLLFNYILKYFMLIIVFVIVFLFQFYSNIICKLIIVFVGFFQKKPSILSILCNPQFYHTYVRWKFLVLYINVSSFFSIILSLYLSAYACIWVFDF